MTVKGEDYAPLGSTELSTIADKVKAAGADAVFNTPNGDSDVAFFKEYKAKYGEAKPFDPEKVRAAASGTAFEAPEGTVTVDGKSQHLAGAELSLLLALPVAFLVAGVLGGGCHHRRLPGHRGRRDRPAARLRRRRLRPRRPPGRVRKRRDSRGRTRPIGAPNRIRALSGRPPGPKRAQIRTTEPSSPRLTSTDHPARTGRNGQEHPRAEGGRATGAACTNDT